MTNALQQRFQEPDGWRWGRMSSARGKSLRYGGSAPAGKPLAHIVYVEGLSEFAEKTFELARDFNAASCAFWVLDRQGQGLSDRPLANRFKQHAVNIGDDAADLIAFVRTVVPKDAPVILQGNSAGGLLSLVAMHEAPELVSGAVLTAPLLGLQNKTLKTRETLFAKLPLPRCVSERYIPDDGDWTGRDKSTRVTPQDYSGDPDRMHLQDYWMKKDEALRVGGVTWGWVQATTRAIALTRKPAWLKEIRQPVEIFTAGRDMLVNNDYTRRALPHFRSATLRDFPTAQHELLMETDDIRQPIIDATLRMAHRLDRPA